MQYVSFLTAQVYACPYLISYYYVQFQEKQANLFVLSCPIYLVRLGSGVCQHEVIFKLGHNVSLAFIMSVVKFNMDFNDRSNFPRLRKEFRAGDCKGSPPL